MYTIDLFGNVTVDEVVKLNAVDFLNHYKKGNFIYPNEIIRGFKLPKDSISWILKALIDNDLVEERRYYRCSRCCNSTISFAKAEYEVMEELCCDRCESDEEINLDEWELVYKLK